MQKHNQTVIYWSHVLGVGSFMFGREGYRWHFRLSFPAPIIVATYEPDSENAALSFSSQAWGEFPVTKSIFVYFEPRKRFW